MYILSFPTRNVLYLLSVSDKFRSCEKGVHHDVSLQFGQNSQMSVSWLKVVSYLSPCDINLWLSSARGVDVFSPSTNLNTITPDCDQSGVICNAFMLVHADWQPCYISSQQSINKFNTTTFWGFIPICSPHLYASESAHVSDSDARFLVKLWNNHFPSICCIYYSRWTFSVTPWVDFFDRHS